MAAQYRHEPLPSCARGRINSMRNVLAAASLFALVGCASSGAIAQDRACSWADATWDTSWAGPGESQGSAPVTLHVVNPTTGDVEGTWGDPVAGEVWGRIVGPDRSAIVGEWGTSRET